jgi:hypothetical protein
MPGRRVARRSGCWSAKGSWCVSPVLVISWLDETAARAIFWHVGTCAVIPREPNGALDMLSPPTRRPGGDDGILPAVRVFFLRKQGVHCRSWEFQMDSHAGSGMGIGSPAEERWPRLIWAVAYLAFSSSYWVMMSAGMRPRPLTSMPRSLAQLRISLFLASFAAVLRTRVGWAVAAVTLRATLT